MNDLMSVGCSIASPNSNLTTVKDDPMPTQTERRECALRALIRKRRKRVALFIDDAHQLHPKTLIGVRRLMEIVRDGKGTLSIVLAAQPKLKNDLLRPSMEEIGERSALFKLDGFGADKKKYLHWLVAQVSAPRTKIDILITDAAATLLCDRLTTPLQFELHVTRAFEEGFRVSQKPLDVVTVNDILAPDLDGLEARLARSGYNAKVRPPEEQFSAKPPETNLFPAPRRAPILLPPNRNRILRTNDNLGYSGHKP